MASRTGVAGAEIALGIILKGGGLCRRLRLALPGALCAMGRDEHPLALKRIPSAVRLLAVVDFGHACSSFSSIDVKYFCFIAVSN